MPRSGGARPDEEPVVSTEALELTDCAADSLAHVVTGAEFEHRRLPGGGPDIHLLQCCLPHSVINRGIYSPAVLISGTFAQNAITIGTMLRQEEPTILNGSNVRMGTVQFYAEKSEICYRAFPDATWLAFVISRERLLEFCLEHLDELPKLPRDGITTFEPSSQETGDQLLDRLRDLTRSLHAFGRLRHSARLAVSVENDFLARIVNIISDKPLVRRANSPRGLRLCSEILNDTLRMVEDDPTEVLDLQSMSKVTGLSPRTLQRTFQSEYGLCPQEWLRVERLNRVRQDLLQNSDSVTHAATRWGFFHLGRFSQYYRELFGERPSQTLARRMDIKLARIESTELEVRKPAA